MRVAVVKCFSALSASNFLDLFDFHNLELVLFSLLLSFNAERSVTLCRSTMLYQLIIYYSPHISESVVYI